MPLEHDLMAAINDELRLREAPSGGGAEAVRSEFS